LMGKPEGKRLLGWCRSRSEDNIEMGLQEIGWWIGGGYGQDSSRSLTEDSDKF